MKSALLASFFDTIENFLATVADTLKFDVLLYIFAGLFVLLVIMTIIRLRFTYEVRAIKSFKKINKYFLKKPYINESNLVEFNRLMKKIPYQLRDRWQYFMLNREGLPSGYMTLYHCVEQPIKTSNYKSTIVMLKYITNICVVLCALLCLFLISGTLTGKSLVQALIIPIGFYILSQLYIYFLNAKFNAVSVDLYEYYLAFVRNLDKASASIPDYVDYELLFTAKEIRDGIPVLREYLEKRALLDKIAREKAKQNESERESFDFTNLGIDGSLLVERALTTSQDYLNTRNRLKDEITKLEAEKDKYDAQYVSIEKDSQRKLQTIKENLDRLQAQLDASANRIEANYIKKQQSAEQAKQAEIEKNLEDLHVKYAQQVQFLEAEIAKRNEAIEVDKKGVSEQMEAEFETYNEKVYTILRNKIDQDDADELKVTRAELDKTRDELESETQEKDTLKLTLDIKGQEIDTMQSTIDALNEKIAKISARDRRNVAKMYDENIQLKKRVAELEEMSQNQVVVADTYDENTAMESEIQEDGEPVYYDANHNVVDFSQYYDENGWFKEFPKVYDADGNYYDFADYYDKYGNLLEQTEESTESEQVDENAEQQVDENVATVESENIQAQNAQDDESVQENDEVAIVADQDQVFVGVDTLEQDGTIVDDEATLQEANDQIVDDTNSVFDTQDNIQDFEQENAQDVEQENAVEEFSQDNEEYADDDVVYYDKDGNVVDFEQFYDEDGRFKEFPKVYDKDGNYYDFADYYDRDGNLLEQTNEINEDDIVPISADEESVFVGNIEPTASEISTSDVLADKPATINADVQSTETAKRGRGRPKKDADDNQNKKRRATRVKDGDKSTAKKTTAKKTAKTTAKSNTAKKAKKNTDSDAKPKSKASTKTDAKKSTKKPVEAGAKKSKSTASSATKTSSKSSSTAKKAKSATTTKKTSAKAKTENKTGAKKKTATTKPSTRKSSQSKSSTTQKRAKKTPKVQEEKIIDDELDILNGQINSEKAILEAKQAELKNKISQTLSELQEKPTVDRDLDEIREIMNHLKEQANEAKKNGLSKEEQKQINKSLSELLRAMANKQNNNK